MSALAPLLDELASRCDCDDKHGFAETYLPGVRIFKATQPAPPSPLLYDCGIIIVGQGAKVGHLGGRSYRYDCVVATSRVPKSA